MFTLTELLKLSGEKLNLTQFENGGVLQGYN